MYKFVEKVSLCLEAEHQKINGAVLRFGIDYQVISQLNLRIGINGEGTAPADHPPAPELLTQKYDHKDVMDILREGNEAHANINPFTPEQLSESELLEILFWLENPKAPVPTDAFKLDPSKRKMILAYEMNGKNMTGEDGLIQLIVEMDEFSSRYSHWVNRIEVR